PRGGIRPVAAVDQARGGIGEAARLDLGQGDRRLDRGDLARAVPAVPAEPVDVDPVVGGRRVDLEPHRLAAVHADLGREALDAGVARALDVPDAARGSGQL